MTIMMMIIMTTIVIERKITKKVAITDALPVSSLDGWGADRPG